MNGWCIFAIVLAILFLLGQLRLGGSIDYIENALSVRVRIGPVRFLVFPLPQNKKKSSKTPKPKQKKNAKKRADGQAKKKSGLTLEGILALAQTFVPLALEAAGCFSRKLVVDRLELCLIIGSTDPADTALLYGKANAVLGALWHPLNQAFHVKEGRCRILPDFQSETIQLSARTELSLKLGQILWLGLYFGVKALKCLCCLRKQQKMKQLERKAA